MKPESHALEVMEKYFKENFNKLDQLGLWKQTLKYAKYKIKQLQGRMK